MPNSSDEQNAGDWDEKIARGEMPSLDDICARYIHMFADFDMTEEQQREALWMIWTLMQTVACTYLGCDPVRLAREVDIHPKRENKTGTPDWPMLELSSFAKELIDPEQVCDGKEKEI